MEIRPQPGVAGDGSGDVQNAVTKSETAALGFRVKSGWAAVVLVTNTADSPRLCDVSRIELCDPRLAETRQPYHAARGQLETDPRKLNRRERAIRITSRQSLTNLFNGYQQKKFRIKQATLVVGSRIDPATIANPHIRAHALEGRLFCSAIEKPLQQHQICTEFIVARDAYSSVAARLNRSTHDLKLIIQDFGRTVAAKHGPWRAEQKLAALAALFSLG